MLTEWRQRDPDGIVVNATTLRLVSLADRSLGLQLVRLEVEQGHADVTVDARFDEAGAGLDPVLLEQDLAVWRTEQSGKTLAMAGDGRYELFKSSKAFDGAVHRRQHGFYTGLPA